MTRAGADKQDSGQDSGFWDEILLGTGGAMSEYIQKGGVISLLLLGALFVTLVLATERVLYFFLSREGSGHPLCQSLRLKNLAQQQASLPASLLQELLQREGARIRQEMLAPLWVLGFIASVAPSTGLLGTVIGLIQSFADMAAQQQDMQQFSAGIWQAMITTAMGLIVAIPALFFHSCFHSLADKRLLQMSLAVPPEVGTRKRNGEESC